MHEVIPQHVPRWGSVRHHAITECFSLTLAECTMASYDLSRFIEAQRTDYARALEELTNGRKTTHWMWYIFPQLAGLGRSTTSRKYGIAGVGEARAYMEHPLLGNRLLACADALLAVQGRTINEILGAPDDMKLRSCATLFAAVTPPGSLFEQLLEKYHDGERDERTLAMLRGDAEAI